MEHSASSAEEVIWRRHALGHQGGPEPALLKHWSLPRSMGPAGATLCQSAGDLARLGAVFLREGAGLLAPGTVKEMTSRQVEVPPTLLADWWGLGPYGKQWGGGIVVGHSGTNIAGSSYLLWAPEHDVAVATTVNCPGLGYPFAKRVFAELFGSLAGLTAPSAPEVAPDVDVPVDRLVGDYEMSGVRFEVTAGADGLVLAMHGTLGETTEPSPLLPLSRTTFLPTDPVVDGNRGWALAFLGPEDQPATHLLNGFFCTRRVS
jgi:CubicO group peptidase (beta-lactamase class C family)